MSTISYVPPELWLEIFQWATSYPEAYATSYRPFCPLETTCQDTAISCSLALVCRLWRALITEFLYRDVRIGHGQSIDTLKGALSAKRGYSKLVRRAVLPFQSTSTSTYSPSPIPSVEVLQLCTGLEVLIRPPSPLANQLSQQHFQFDADLLPLPSLKRLEWNYNPNAELSGGINSLGATLQGAPNLQYLSISSVPRYGPMMDLRQIITLPLLETLAVSSLNGQLMHQIANRWSLPSLSHLILSALSVPDVSPLWETYGGQLQSLELGRHASFLVHDVISSALNGCPRLEELNYHIFFVLPPTLVEAQESIHTVGLHSSLNQMFTQTAMCDLVQQHLEHLITSFSSLRTIRLFGGEWSQILGHPQLVPSFVRLRQKGCELVVCKS